MSEVSERIHRVQRELERLGRPEVELAGVTKEQPLDRIREALAAGLKILANNYAQPGEALMESLPDAEVEWHFIGHIQSRKVKYLPTYDCVQSLDRLEIASALDQRLKVLTRTQSVLLEVNIGREPQKSGILPESLESFLEAARQFKQLRLIGLMGMPPGLPDAQARRPFFRELRGLFERHQERFGLSRLSMGTSEDYIVAVQEGSTMVRLGATLFGPREK